MHAVAQASDEPAVCLSIVSPTVQSTVQLLVLNPSTASALVAASCNSDRRNVAQSHKYRHTLLGRIGLTRSGVRVIASFPKNSPPRGSVRVRTPPRGSGLEYGLMPIFKKIPPPRGSVRARTPPRGSGQE